MKAKILAATAIFIAGICPAQAQDRSRFNWLFDKFTEVGIKAEQNCDIQMACGMYESALENTSFSSTDKVKYTQTLASLIRCYSKSGYYWRVEKYFDKLSAILESDPTLLSTAVREAMNGYVALLEDSGRTQDSIFFRRRVDKLLERSSIAGEIQKQ